jgi:osmotically-inducible protein OsmY
VTLEQRILADLNSHPSDTSRIRVAAADDGRVTLEGAVQTYADKCCVEEMVRRMPGVAEVRNALEVRLTVGDYRTDATLERVLRDLLECLSRMPPELPRATVVNGWVTLDGIVLHAFQKQLVEQIVREVAGVRGITNHIAIAGFGVRRLAAALVSKE